MTRVLTIIGISLLAFSLYAQDVPDPVLQSNITYVAEHRTDTNWCNIRTQQHGVALPQLPVPLPNPVGPIFGCPASDAVAAYYWSEGWRLIRTNSTPDAGYRMDTVQVVEVDQYTADVVITHQVNIAEEQAAAYAADIAANANRYTLENAYIMLCDMLRQDQSHTLIGMGEFATRMAGLKQASDPAYNRMRDGFSFIKSQLDPIDAQWTERAQYRDVPALVAAAQDMINMLP